MQINTVNDIMDEALGEFLQIVAWRREMHAHPELSFREYRTAEFISGILEREGIKFRSIAKTGVLAELKGSAEGSEHDRRAVVLRADIDALPLNEANETGFSSQNAGVMHACGHDIHAAILLGALRIINRRKDSFLGTVFGLFQPGEELNPGGASLVLKENPFDDHEIIAFVGEHVEPTLPTGAFGFRKGKYMASSDELRFTLRGTGGHAAMRGNIKDPVLAGADFIGRLHDLAAKYHECVPPVVSIGKVIANGATNVIPDEVYMEGTMRVFDERLRKSLKDDIRMTAENVGRLHGVNIDVDISDGYPPVINDGPLTGYVIDATKAMFGENSTVELGHRPTSDDFGFYCQLYPSVYYRLGVGGEGEFFEERKAGKIHTPTFNPDEKAIGYGTAQFVNIAIGLLTLRE